MLSYKTSLRLPDELIDRLRLVARDESARTRRPVSWAALARAMLAVSVERVERPPGRRKPPSGPSPAIPA